MTTKETLRQCDYCEKPLFKNKRVYWTIHHSGVYCSIKCFGESSLRSVDGSGISGSKLTTELIEELKDEGVLET